MDRIVITGIGLSSNFAGSLEGLYNALSNDIPLPGAVPLPDIKRKGLVFTDNITKKLYGVFECVKKDAKLSDSEEEKNRMGIFLGNAQGSLDSIVSFETNAIVKGYKSVLPGNFINTVMNAPAGQLAVLTGITGMNMTYSNGSSAAVSAMECGADMLRSKVVDVAIVGGVEDISPLYEDYIKGFGGIPSGGICLLTEERESTAIERGAKIYAAWHSSASGYCESPKSETIYEIMNKAVVNSGLSEEDIDFIVISTLKETITVVEEQAVLKFACPYFNIKKVSGELGGVSGAFATAAAVSIMQNKKMPDGTKLNKTQYALIGCIGLDGFIDSFVLSDK